MMQTTYSYLVVRDNTDSKPNDSTMTTLLITLLVLIIIALLAVMALLYMRYRRRILREETLPVHNDRRSSTRSNHRRLQIRPSESIYVYQEKQILLEDSDPPPTSPLPEIRITFPEEVDDAGKRQSGRVVVVHVGETSLGLEPYSEKLPSYQQTESERFQSLDLDRIGGLKEKDMEAQWQ